MLNSGNAIVDAIGTLDFQGNITPPSWYQHIRYSNKRGEYTDHLAVSILADVVYWYRPIKICDEVTGSQIGWRKKFSADLMQRSYQSYAAYLGASYKQIIAAFDLLSKLGLIRRHFRTIHTSTGTMLEHVMFIEPIVERIQEITYKISSEEFATLCQSRQAGTKKSRKSHVPKSECGAETLEPNEDSHPIHVPKSETTCRNRKPHAEIGGTYTKTTSRSLNINNKHKHKQAQMPFTGTSENSFFDNGEEFFEEISETDNKKPINISPLVQKDLGEETTPLPPSLRRRDVSASADVSARPRVTVEGGSKKPVDIKFVENDLGWIQMPQTKRFTLARAITVRRLQYVLATQYRNIEVYVNDRGVTPSNGNEIYWLANGQIVLEEELFYEKETGLQDLRDSLFARSMVTQAEFNELLKEVFIDSVDWLAEKKAEAQKILAEKSKVLLFYDRDRQTFADIRSRLTQAS